MNPKMKPIVTELVSTLTTDTKSGDVKWEYSRGNDSELHYHCFLGNSKIGIKIGIDSSKSLKGESYSHWLTIDDPNLSERVNVFENAIIFGLIRTVYDKYASTEKVKIQKTQDKDINTLKEIVKKTSLQSRRDSKLEKILDGESLLDKIKRIF